MIEIVGRLCDEICQKEKETIFLRLAMRSYATCSSLSLYPLLRHRFVERL